MAFDLFADFVSIDIAQHTLGIDKLVKTRRNLAFVMEMEVASQDGYDFSCILLDAVDKGQGFFCCIRMI